MRLFVAVWPSSEVVDAVSAHARPELDGVRWTRPDQWHVTLRFLGTVDPDEVPAIVAAVRAAATPHAPIIATMGPATDRFGGSILHVPVAGLDALAVDVTRACSGFGAAPLEDRPFLGHLTLARAGHRRGPDGKRQRGRIPLELTGQPLAATWTVRDVTLVRSDLHHEGARYETLASVPLNG